MATGNMKSGFQGKDIMRDRAHELLGSELRSGKMQALKKGGAVKPVKKYMGGKAADMAPTPAYMTKKPGLKKGGKAVCKSAGGAVSAKKGGKAAPKPLSKKHEMMETAKKKVVKKPVKKSLGGVMNALGQGAQGMVNATPIGAMANAGKSMVQGVANNLKKGGKASKAKAAPKPVKKAMGGVGKERKNETARGMSKKRGK